MRRRGRRPECGTGVCARSGLSSCAGFSWRAFENDVDGDEHIADRIGRHARGRGGTMARQDGAASGGSQVAPVGQMGSLVLHRPGGVNACGAGRARAGAGPAHPGLIEWSTPRPEAPEVAKAARCGRGPQPQPLRGPAGLVRDRSYGLPRRPVTLVDCSRAQWHTVTGNAAAGFKAENPGTAGK